MIQVLNKPLQSLIGYGITDVTSENDAEQMRLINGISLMGVPVCLLYGFVFGFTGFYFFSIIAFLGTPMFALPLLLNKWFGTRVGSNFLSFFAPAYFCLISVICGPECGFYLGFIILAMPAIFFYQSNRSKLFSISIALFFALLSFLISAHVAPYAKIPYSRIIYYANFVEVFVLCLLVIYLFQNALEESRTQIREKHKQIQDSIQYAKRIQNAILPADSYIQQYVKDYFLLYKPKDIVAGDFYWLEVQNNTVYFAAADCTGHGVPGAMVSVVCYNALNRAVREFGLTETGQILDKVTDLILETFEKSLTDVKDGMDISLLAIKYNKSLTENTNNSIKSIQWSGANNPLWYFKEHEHFLINADKQPVGKSYDKKPFTTHTVEYKVGMRLYLITDGFADQFGGPAGKKLMRKQLLNKLNEINSFEMNVQKSELENMLHEWQGKRSQVDDITVIGLKL